ncbi:MAG: RNA polymerase sigma factor [Betaproteobacteria bacterium]
MRRIDGPDQGASVAGRDDRALVDACLACNDQAIRQLIATHRPAIARLAWTLLGSDEVDDVCQDVYLRVFRRLGDFEHRSRLGTWIYRVALNVIRNRQRAARRRHLAAHLSLDDVSPRDHLKCLVHPADADALSESNERARRVRRAIRRLPPVQRRALILWTYGDSSHVAIARSTGQSLPDVKRTLRQARLGLRTHMNEGASRHAVGEGG